MINALTHHHGGNLGSEGWPTLDTCEVDVCKVLRKQSVKKTGRKSWLKPCGLNGHIKSLFLSLSGWLTWNIKACASPQFWGQHFLVLAPVLSCFSWNVFKTHVELQECFTCSVFALI